MEPTDQQAELDELRAKLAEALEQVDELSALVHTCPKCGEYCKQCMCTEDRIATAERQRDEAVELLQELMTIRSFSMPPLQQKKIETLFATLPGIAGPERGVAAGNAAVFEATPHAPVGEAGQDSAEQPETERP